MFTAPDTVVMASLEYLSLCPPERVRLHFPQCTRPVGWPWSNDGGFSLSGVTHVRFLCTQRAAYTHNKTDAFALEEPWTSGHSRDKALNAQDVRLSSLVPKPVRNGIWKPSPHSSHTHTALIDQSLNPASADIFGHRKSKPCWKPESHRRSAVDFNHSAQSTHKRTQLDHLITGRRSQMDSCGLDTHGGHAIPDSTRGSRICTCFFCQSSETMWLQ